MTEQHYYPTQCPCCDSWTHDVESRHMSTSYVEPASNMLMSCLSCFEESERYWAETWREYYAGRL